MKKILIALCLAVITGGAKAQSFQEFITYLNALPQDLRQAKVDSFSALHPALPLLEGDTTCNFIWQGSASTVFIAGDFTGWSPSLGMITVPGTNLYYRTRYFEADARLDYKFVLNGGNWILDPKNPHTCTGGYGPNSELRMPGYAVHPETVYDPTIPHGTLKDTSFYSQNLGNSRTIRIYLPPGYGSSPKIYPVMLFHDGPEYISLAGAVNILDYLIAHEEMTAIIAVFVPPVNRTAEYAGNLKDAFTAFIVGELMPYIDTRYATSRDPGRRATAGVSNGGNISLYLGMKHPEVFGKICTQSGNVESVISSTFQNSPKMDLDIYIDIGTYDIAVLIPLARNFRQILVSKGYSHAYHEWHEGHSWGNWRDHLRLPLTRFFPYSMGFNEIRSNEKVRLFQNAPNPFSTCSLIRFETPAGASAELSLFDLSGRLLKTLFSGMGCTGIQSVEVPGSDLPEGSYICRLQSDGRIRSRTLTIVR